MERNLSLVLIFGFSHFVACLVMAAVGFISIESLSRNPSAAPRIYTMFVGGMFATFILTFMLWIGISR